MSKMKIGKSSIAVVVNNQDICRLILKKPVDGKYEKNMQKKTGGSGTAVLFAKEKPKDYGGWVM